MTLHELQEARDKVTMGPARRSRVMSLWQKQLTAYHEAGHAVIAFYLQPYADPIHKATIVSRGSALGFVEQVRLLSFDRNISVCISSPNSSLPPKHFHTCAWYHTCLHRQTHPLAYIHTSTDAYLRSAVTEASAGLQGSRDSEEIRPLLSMSFHSLYSICGVLEYLLQHTDLFSFASLYPRHLHFVIAPFVLLPRPRRTAEEENSPKKGGASISFSPLLRRPVVHSSLCNSSSLICFF